MSNVVQPTVLAPSYKSWIHFSKAFDTVCHHTLLCKLDIPKNAYN